MKIVFIADGHLNGEADPNQRSLIKFLDSLNHVKALVVLGDLFDFWTGSNEAVYQKYLPVLDSLMKLKQRGTGIIYLEGNHDFSMGRFFTSTLEAGVYPDFFETEFGGRRFYLSHGDLVGASMGHRVWRQFLRSGLFRLIARAVGPHAVCRIASSLSHKSRRYNKATGLDDRLKEFAGTRVREGADFVLLGHSHIPGVHMIDGGGRPGIYANPGSWAGDRSYLVFDGEALKVKKWGP